MGTAWPDGGWRIEKVRLLHQIPMDSVKIGDGGNFIAPTPLLGGDILGDKISGNISGERYIDQADRNDRLYWTNEKDSKEEDSLSRGGIMIKGYEASPPPPIIEPVISTPIFIIPGG